MSGDETYDGNNKYLYDAEGRICAVQNTTAGVMTGYIYDADGNRVAKGTITSWGSCDPSLNGFQTSNETDEVHGLGGEQVTEMAMGANGNMAWAHTNVWAGGKLLATYDPNGLHFYLDDPLGTRRAQTDYAGVLEQTCASLPFGNQLNCTGSITSPTEHHFTGKERDVESGNDYFEARYYASSFGRFLIPDWSAKVEPVPYAKLDNPQTLNLYAYVLNNPLTVADSDGHEAMADPGFDQGGCGKVGGCQYGDTRMDASTGRMQMWVPRGETSASFFGSAAYLQIQLKQASPEIVVAADAPGKVAVNGVNTDLIVNYRAHTVNKNGSLGSPVRGEINLRERVLSATPGMVWGNTCTPQCEGSTPYFPDEQGVGNGKYLNVMRVWTYNRRVVGVWDPVQQRPAKAEILHEEYGNDPSRYFQMTYVH